MAAGNLSNAQLICIVYMTTGNLAKITYRKVTPQLRSMISQAQSVEVHSPKEGPNL